MLHFEVIQATYCPGTKQLIELKKCRACVWNCGVHIQETGLYDRIDCGVTDKAYLNSMPRKGDEC